MGRKIFLFMMVSLDGFMEGENHDLSWHNVDAEFNEFAIKQLDEVDTLIFGRRTYELMEEFWPSEQGVRDDPEVAQRMNNLPKIVFSRTLGSVKETKNWKNVRLVKDATLEELTALKKQKGPPGGEAQQNIAVLGSNNLCVTLLQLGLLDELRIMVNPVVIGKGTALFAGIQNKLALKLRTTRRFKNGNMLLVYQPER